jgi:hypothetical protein
MDALAIATFLLAGATFLLVAFVAWQSGSRESSSRQAIGRASTRSRSTLG